MGERDYYEGDEPEFAAHSNVVLTTADERLFLRQPLGLRQTGSWMPEFQNPARFIEPMLLLCTEKLPEGDGRLYELKLDGYRAEAITTGGRVLLRSRKAKYPTIVIQIGS